jgi:hypothetical protein
MNDKMTTVAGVVVGGPEYEVIEGNKRAWVALSVIAKRRIDDEWIDDPPVVYHVLVRDDAGLAVVASIAPESRLLVSGVITSEAPLVLEAADLMPSDTRRGL